MSAWRTAALACTAALATFAGAVHAQGLPLLSPITADTPGPPLPNWRASGTARFVCGGASDREQQSLRGASPRDLLLTFADASGRYLADASIEIRQGDRLVLQTRCEGPLMVLDLPRPGPYEVVARIGGVEQRASFDVPAGGGLSAVLRWPQGAGS